MYHYDPEMALEELNEDLILPNPLHIRDMMIRAGLDPVQAVELTHRFQSYQQAFTDAQAVARMILEELVGLHSGK